MASLMGAVAKHIFLVTDPTKLEATLRSWRTGQAKRLGVPAFRVMTDKVLLGIAEQSQPGQEQAVEKHSGRKSALVKVSCSSVTGYLLRFRNCDGTKPFSGTEGISPNERAHQRSI